MEKTYILDTNVLLYDPQAIFKFADNEVVIPITVIEEIDNFKKELSETGRNARQLSRVLDELRNEQGSLAQGVKLKEGGMLRVEIGTNRGDRLGKLFTRRQADIAILSIALEVKEKAGSHPVIFLTKDTNLRIRADALGLTAEDYDPEVVMLEELYAGWRKVSWPAEKVNELMKARELDGDGLDARPNEMFLIVADENPQQSVLARAVQEGGALKLHAINDTKRPVWGIQPRNVEQSFALQLLMDDSVRLVTLVGKAGTGKTLVAIAAGLHKVTDEQVYQRVLISRPVFPLGRDIGFLPGDLEEKLLPWMQPIFDNVEFLTNLSHEKKRQGHTYGYRELMDMGLLGIEPLTYIRGRSISSQYMVVDEAQNLTPHEIKTIITRAGDNTKVVLTGDPYQIDNPYVDSSNNGLTYVVEKFKREKVAGHVTLTRGERSPLAELASNLL